MTSDSSTCDYELHALVGEPFAVPLGTSREKTRGGPRKVSQDRMPHRSWREAGSEAHPSPQRSCEAAGGRTDGRRAVGFAHLLFV